MKQRNKRQKQNENNLQWVFGKDRVSELCKEFDWTSTELGAIEEW